MASTTAASLNRPNGPSARRRTKFARYLQCDRESPGAETMHTDHPLRAGPGVAPVLNPQSSETDGTGRRSERGPPDGRGNSEFMRARIQKADAKSGDALVYEGDVVGQLQMVLQRGEEIGLLTRDVVDSRKSSWNRCQHRRRLRRAAESIPEIIIHFSEAPGLPAETAIQEATPSRCCRRSGAIKREESIDRSNIAGSTPASRRSRNVPSRASAEPGIAGHVLERPGTPDARTLSRISDAPGGQAGRGFGERHRLAEARHQIQERVETEVGYSIPCRVMRLLEMRRQDVDPTRTLTHARGSPRCSLRTSSIKADSRWRKGR